MRRNAKTPNNVRSWPSNNENCKNLQEIIRFYSRISKKNTQSLVSNADREIPTLGSTDNAGNEVYRVSGTIRLPSGWDISVCIRTNDRIYLSYYLWCYYFPFGAMNGMWNLNGQGFYCCPFTDYFLSIRCLNDVFLFNALFPKAILFTLLAPSRIIIMSKKSI